MGSNIFQESGLFPTQQEADNLIRTERLEGEIIKTKGTLKICTKVSPNSHVFFGLIEI